MLVEIVEGFWCNPELVVVVKKTGDDSCAVFTTGQPATDGGFTLQYTADEVAQQINDAEQEMYADEEGGGENSDGNDE